MAAHRLFRQSRELDTNMTLRRALAPDGDRSSIRIASFTWRRGRRKFLFTESSFTSRSSAFRRRTSPRADRSLMLQPADVLYWTSLPTTSTSRRWKFWSRGYSNSEAPWCW